MTVITLIVALATSQPPVLPIPTNAAVVALEGEFRFYPADFVFCVKVAGKDAPTDVLLKLSRDDRTIVPGSKCRSVVEPWLGSYETKTKRHAAILDLSNLKWESNSSLTLTAHSHYHGKWGHTRELELVLTDEQWKISRVGLEGEN